MQQLPVVPEFIFNCVKVAHGVKLTTKSGTLMDYISPACLPLPYSVEVMVALTFRMEDMQARIKERYLEAHGFHRAPSSVSSYLAQLS